MENSPSAAKHETAGELGHRPVAPEANQLHGKKLPPERIGQVLVAADMEAGRDKKPSKHAATMSRSELLDMSSEIIIDNTTLRHIYDTHLISENGLRRLVYENMHGGDIRQSLHHEILEHQTDFERDPQLRGQLLRSDQRPGGVSLRDLLAKTGIVETEPDNRQTAETKKSESSPKPTRREYLEQHLKQQAYQRKLLDFVFVGIILLLLILVILLALIRR